MFVRTKTFRNQDGTTRTYLQLVESVREGGRPRQRVVANLGRIEELEAGKLDAIIASLARFSQSTWRRLEQEAERLVVRWSKSWGPVLVFERLWREAELDRAFVALLSDRKLAFDVAEAVFVMVLNRLTDPASKRGLVHRWLEGIYRPEAERLQLHHFYRALDELCAHKEGSSPNRGVKVPPTGSCSFTRRHHVPSQHGCRFQPLASPATPSRHSCQRNACR